MCHHGAPSLSVHSQLVQIVWYHINLYSPQGPSSYVHARERPGEMQLRADNRSDATSPQDHLVLRPQSFDAVNASKW